MNRPLTEIIKAVETTVSELGFHIDRLEHRVDPDTDSERDHLTDLLEGYTNAKHYLGILLRYQRGRLAREGGVPEKPDVPDTTPFTGDSHAD